MLTAGPGSKFTPVSSSLKRGSFRRAQGAPTLPQEGASSSSRAEPPAVQHLIPSVVSSHRHALSELVLGEPDRLMDPAVPFGLPHRT